MPAPADDRWTQLSDSPFPWEAEALDYVRSVLPPGDGFRGWTLCEFVASDGSVNEVDAVLLTPRGLLLIEVKSHPGVIEGDVGLWRYTNLDGRVREMENPLLLANRKAKRLKDLLGATRAMKKDRRAVPYVQAEVFLSSAQLDCRLAGPAVQHVWLRNAQSQPDRCFPDLLREHAATDPAQRLTAADVRAVTAALGEIGLRKIQRDVQVGDWRLKELLADGEYFQDWVAEHVRVAGSRRRVRLWPWPRSGPESGRKARRLAAQREFTLLERVEHPGFLTPQDCTESERGAALVYDHPEPAEQLDKFLARKGRELDLRTRLRLVRELADTLAYAHGRHLYHRALTPQAILVLDPDSEAPRLKLLNWQIGRLEEDGSAQGPTLLSWTDVLQVGLGGRESNAVYLAPELRSDANADPVALDVFSCGAVAYHLLSGVPPAASPDDLLAKLREKRGLHLAAVVDGVDEDVATAIELATASEPANRLELTTFLDEIDAALGRLTAATTPDADAVHPLDAEVGARLDGGFLVERRLGSGSTAVALLVSRDGQRGVLKVARETRLNERLEAEAEVLRKIRHQHVVELYDVVTLRGHVALFLESAGDTTLAQRLRQEGALTLELLQRFGDELLTTLDWLERQGVPHRDLKPDNIGVGLTRTKERTLRLFDFSLSGTPAEQIRAGTPGYLDPFLSERTPPRWDPGAERYAAAVTLHEMATGTLPQWGDGGAHPATLPDDTRPALAAERFDPSVRDALTRFFLRALARKPKGRFDTAEEMRRAWSALFAAIDRPTTTTGSDTETVDVTEALAGADAATPLAALGLTPRLLNALERVGAQTVGQLAEVSGRRLYGTPGIGLRTLKEMKQLADTAARLLAARVRDGTEPSEVLQLTNGNVDVRFWSVDDLAGGLVGRLVPPEPQILRDLSGLEAPLEAEGDDAWPASRTVADTRNFEVKLVREVLDRARARWLKAKWMTPVREWVSAFVAANGGVATREELADALVRARGSVDREGPLRRRKAAAVVWAAVEAEAALKEPRFRLHRAERHLLVAASTTADGEPGPDGASLLAWLDRLGALADRLAAEDPPLPPHRALEELKAAPAPAGLPELAPDRLLRLAVAASRTAALTPRRELYPRGLSAARAVALGTGALLGARKLAPNQVQERILARYPESEQLPGRPALDDLLRSTGLGLEWDEAQSAYILPPPGSSRSSTQATHAPTQVGRPLDNPADQFARQLDDVCQSGGFLALLTEPKRYTDVARALAADGRFRRVSLERLALDAMRATAADLGAQWRVVLEADSQTADAYARRNLTSLMQRSEGRILAALAALDGPVLLVYPGLLAHHGRLGLLESLMDGAGRGAPTLLLIAADGQAARPVVDGHMLAAPLPSQWMRVPRSWVQRTVSSTVSAA